MDQPLYVYHVSTFDISEVTEAKRLTEKRENSFQTLPLNGGLKSITMLKEAWKQNNLSLRKQTNSRKIHGETEQAPPCDSQNRGGFENM
jgi:hypothetical protein